MESYFFVPANRLHKFASIKQLGIDYIVVDFEDAIKTSEREILLGDLNVNHIPKDTFIRVPLYNLKNELSFDFYLQLKALGFRNFVFPKLQNIVDLTALIEYLDGKGKSILLVETPLLFVELKDVLSKYAKYFYGIALGSHDLMNAIGGIHTLQNLEFYRQQLLLYSRAYQVMALDIASMELKDAIELRNEILDGFRKGFDGKFYIHPWQIAQKDLIKFYTNNDFKWAKKVFAAYKEVNDKEEFNPIVVDGEIIEKPHLNRVFNILKYFKEDESK